MVGFFLHKRYICNMNSPDIRVAVFEDNSALRDTLKMIIDFTPGYACVGAFENGNDLKARMEAVSPQVILMDIDMPGMNGIDAVETIKQDFPEIRIIMQTIFDDETNIFRAICAGADGYLLKNTPPARLIAGIEEVMLLLHPTDKVSQEYFESLILQKMKQ
jgi:DNA-binding NarL/FixJ family response regulator